MARLATVIDSNADDRAAAGDDADSRGPWRALLAALGLAAAVYLVLRWRRSDAETAIDALPEPLAKEAEGVLEDAQPIEIDVPGEDGESESPEDETEAESEAGEETGDGSSGGEIDESPSLDTPTADRSAEEIAERTESDAQGKPAEPGEMAIDEEVADEVLNGDESNEDEDDER